MMKSGGDWLVAVLVITAILAMIAFRYGPLLFG